MLPYKKVPELAVSRAWVRLGLCLDPAPSLGDGKAKSTSRRDVDKGDRALRGQGAAEPGSPQPAPRLTCRTLPRGEEEVTSFCKLNKAFHPQVVPGVPISGSWTGGVGMWTAGSWAQIALCCHVEAKNYKGAQQHALCFLDD